MTTTTPDSPDDEIEIDDLPDVITVEVLLDLPADSIPELAKRTGEMTPTQAASFVEAQSELAAQFQRAIKRSALSPSMETKIKEMMGDVGYPKALRETASEIMRRYAEQRVNALDLLKRSSLTDRSPMLARAADEPRGTIIHPSSGPPRDHSDLISLPVRTTDAHSVAPAATPMENPTLASVRDRFDEQVEEKGELEELVDMERKRQQNDERLVALFWIVSIAAIVQGVSTLVASNSWLEFGATLVVSSVLVLIALWYWRKPKAHPTM